MPRATTSQIEEGRHIMAQSPITVAVVGDYMIQEIPSAEDIALVQGFFGDADITIANIDTVLSDKGEPIPKWANLRGPPEVVDHLKEMGIDVVTVANNHAMDFRAEGLLDMLDAYDEAGLTAIGAGANLAVAAAPAIVTVGERSVAILSFSCLLPIASAAGPTWPGIAPMHVHQSFVVDELLMTEQPGTVPEVKCWLDEKDLARVLKDITNARAQADIVIPIVHWGVPSPWLAPSHPIIQKHQRVLGHALIDAGADAVMGIHAHELHGIEFYKDKPIAYCLGNFWITGISDYAWMGFESLVMRLVFGEGSTPEVEIVPLMLNDDGHPRTDSTLRTIDLMNQLSAVFGVTVEEVDGRFVAQQGR